MAYDLNNVQQIIDEFGEDIVYKPSGGRPRTITAIVDRNPETGTDGRPLVVVITQSVHITVWHDEQKGIDPAQFNTNLDKIVIDVRPGTLTKRTLALRALVGTQDRGMVTFEAR